MPIQVDVGDAGSIPELGRSPVEGNGNPLKHSCLENSIDRGAWRSHRATKCQTYLKRLSMHVEMKRGAGIYELCGQCRGPAPAGPGIPKG